MSPAMYIALITPTCRENPRSMEASRTIAAAVRHAPEDAKFIWIIVDEKARPLDVMIDLKNEFVAKTLDSGKLEVMLVPPLPSPHRASGPNKAPAHNSARSAGLMVALDRGCNYISFLNDCNIVTYGVGKVLYDCAKQGVGYRAKPHEVADMPIPADGVVKFKDHHDLLRRIPVESAAGALWGAPAKAFGEIHGFDLSYDGQRYGNDLDCVVRLSRVGVTYVTTERAFVIQLRRTKVAEEISTRKDVQHGERNRQLYNDLIRDKTRIFPLWAAGEPEPTSAPAQVAAPPAVEEPKPKWKKRAPPVVGANVRSAPRRGQAPIDPSRTPGNAPAAAAPAPAKPVTPPPPPADSLDDLGDGDIDPLDELEDDGSNGDGVIDGAEQKAIEQESAAAAVAAAQLRAGVPPAKA